MATTAKSVILRDKDDGKQLLPMTRAELVILNNGTSVETGLANKQDALVSGTNIKTVNNESLLGSGNISVAGTPGEPGDDGVGISSVVQTTESTVSGGTNVITVTKTDGTTSTFNVRNGDAVGSATIVQTTGDSTTAVMSQDGTTKALAKAAQTVKTGTSMIFNSYTVTKLSADQVAAINAVDEITVKWVIKCDGLNMMYRYATVCSMAPYYNIAFSYFQTLSVYYGQDYNSDWLGKHGNGDTSMNHYYNWCNQCMVINRVTGRVRLYQNTTLLIDETSDDYKKAKFISDDGYIMFQSGDSSAKFYALQIYDHDVTRFFTWPETNGRFAMLWSNDAGKDVPPIISTNFALHGYEVMNEYWLEFYVANSTGVQITGNGNRYSPHVCTFINGTAVAGTSAINCIGWSGAGSYASQFFCYLNVSGGVVNIPATYNSQDGRNIICDVYDANTGNKVADQTNIGNGDYIVIFDRVSAPGAYIYYVSGQPVVSITDAKSKPICCVVDIRLDTLYGDKLIDNEAGTEYPLYAASNDYESSIIAAWTNKNPASVTLCKSKITGVYTGQWMPAASTPPPINGDMYINFEGTILYGDAVNHVWKQINNA